MRSKLLFLGLLAIGMLTIVGSAQANLFTNASFENGNFGVDVDPEGWFSWEPGGVNTWLDSSGPDGAAHQGTKMMKFQSTGVNTRTMFFNLGSADVLTEFGVQYWISFWGKAADGETIARTAFKYEWHMNPGEDGQGTAIVENIPNLTVGTEWERKLLDLTPPDATHLWFRYVFNHESAYEDILIDDLHFATTFVEGVDHPVSQPIPGDGAESVASTQTILSWVTKSFPEGDPDGRFPEVEVYWGDRDDPNFWGFTNGAGELVGGGEPLKIGNLADANEVYNHQIDLSAIPAPLGGPIALATNEVYYWALKYQDPNWWENPTLQEGPVWSFDTVNRPPTVDGGLHADRWLPAAGSVKVGLDASYTDDGLPAAGPLTYSWVSNPACPSCFTPSNTVEDPNFETATAGDYILTLTVNDGDTGSDGSDSVLVRVFGNSIDRLRAHYPLDTDATDSVGGHNGTLEDNPVFGSGGQVVGAIELDGADSDADGYGDFVSIGDTGSDPNWQGDTWENSGLIDGMTVSAWMNLANGWTKGWQAIAAKSNYSWELLRDANNDGVAFSVQGGIGGAISSADADVTSGWHQVAGVYNRNEVLIYVDGLLEGSVSAGTIDLEANPQNTQNWQIQKSAGKVNIGQTNNLDTPASELSFEGLIDQVRIFDAAVPWRADHSGTPGIVELYRADIGHLNCGDDFIDSDVNEDCYTNLGDFAVVVFDWMDCNDAANADCDD